MSEAPRQTKRYPLSAGLQVSCESWGAFVQLYAGDIGQGGMFILCEEQPEAFAEVEVKIQLPEGHDVMLKAKVVHVLTKEAAAEKNTQAGVGVQFMEMPDEVKREIHHLVEFARWEGAAPDAKSSYASHMFERTASMPLKDTRATLDSLPLTPEMQTAIEAADAGAAVTARRKKRKKRVRADGSSTFSDLQDGDARMSAPAGARKSKNPSATPEPPEPKEPEKPSFTPVDGDTIKEAMSHMAHKRYPEGIKMLQDAVSNSGPDPNALKWLYLAQARLANERNKEEEAASAYRRLLELDEDNREAREYVRTHSRDGKLAAIPFGRFFTTKKK